ncbi:hypothetical protein ACEQ8H_008708 [Pleosporales sp. CAS-2024a]
MSTRAAAGSEEARPRTPDRRMSLGKYVKRMSSVFKRDKPTKHGGQPAMPPRDAPAVAAPPDAVTVQEVQEVQEAASTQTPTTTPTKTATATLVLDRHALQQERARALFAKYGLTLDTHEWIAAPAPMPAVQRVEKAIRMRVHRSCHHCGSVYGAEKVCLQCEHKRCKKCPQYPKRRRHVDGEHDQPRLSLSPGQPQRKRLLTMATTRGDPLAHQPPKHRVRRSCHKCHTLFVPSTATICEQCRHIRCTKCPREPAKLHKWPDGYPGDVDPNSDSEVEKQLDKFRRTWRKPRQRVRWECEQCTTAFITGSPQCPGCGHQRCEKCTRSPIKKTKKEAPLTPQLVAAVEAKLKALDVDSDLPSSGPEGTSHD